MKFVADGRWICFVLFVSTAVSVELSGGWSSTLTADAIVANIFEIDRTMLDSEVGVELHRLSFQTRGSEPGALAAYCSGQSDGVARKGQQVKGNWKEYGTYYPGEVVETHRDKSVDILYDDGMTERRVEANDVKPVKSKDQVVKMKDDAACLLTNSVDRLKTKIKTAFDDLKNWLQNARTKKATDASSSQTKPPSSGFLKSSEQEQSMPLAPAPAVALSPGSTAISEDSAKAAKLEKLKQDLASTNARVDELEQRIAANDVEIHGKTQLQNETGSLTIDNLIQQYENKIATRMEYMHYLEQRLVDQATYLAQNGVTLDDIGRAIEDIGLDIEEVKRTRDEIEKKGKLDPELQAAADNIIAQGASLRSKLTKLMAAEDRAKQARVISAPFPAGAEVDRSRPAGVEAGSEAADASRSAEAEVFAAAEELQAEVEAVDKGTKSLDEGVVPSDKKWWRYRYQHALVEAVMMILISILMLIWERFYHYLRSKAYRQTEEGEEHTQMAFGTTAVSWLEYFAGELMVCTLVFLTVWLLIKLGCLHYLTFILEDDEFMRFPKRGDEYGHLAIDICVVLFWTVFFYFLVVLSVVRATNARLQEWAQFEISQRRGKQGDAVLGSIHKSSIASTIGVTFASDSDDYVIMRNHFIDYLEDEKQTELLRELKVAMETKGVSPMMPPAVPSSRCIQGTADHPGGLDFPFWKYIRLSVRQGVDVLFQFGVVAWMMIVSTFIGFIFLHYYFHMGYIRIMSFFIVFLFLQLFFITWMVLSTRNQVVSGSTTENFWNVIHRKFNTERLLAHMVFYNLFILCYGAARIFFQPWMWELHFRVVCCLLVLTLLLGAFFCIVVAPMLPVFMAVMALPPFVDEENRKAMVACLVHGVDAEEYVNW